MAGATTQGATFTHRWHSNGSNLGLSVLPKDTSTCGLEEPGIAIYILLVCRWLWSVVCFATMVFWTQIDKQQESMTMISWNYFRIAPQIVYEQWMNTIGLFLCLYWYPWIHYIMDFPQYPLKAMVWRIFDLASYAPWHLSKHRLSPYFSFGRKLVELELSAEWVTEILCGHARSCREHI